uniref:Uncharacterized protein n=1 Tax=Arundo donax TaxID=35708 RepID=A0A0A9GU72_ARUDO
MSIRCRVTTAAKARSSSSRTSCMSGKGVVLWAWTKGAQPVATSYRVRV